MTVSLEFLAAERAAIKELVNTTSVTSVPSNEALSIHRAAMAIIERFSLFLGKISDRFKTPMVGLVDQKGQISASEFRLVTELQKAMANANYIDMVDLRVTVVPGLSVTWGELLESWKGPVNFSVNFYDDYLAPFEKFLAIATTDPEKFTTVGSINRINQLDIEGFLSALTAGLAGNKKTNLRAYGQCVERNADAVSALDTSLKYAQALHKGNLELVKGTVNRTADLLTTLSAQIKDSNLPYRLNAKTINDLTDIVFQMAKMTELYAATFTYVESQKNAMENATAKLLSAIK